jgi:hypothetical protein
LHRCDVIQISCSSESRRCDSVGPHSPVELAEHPRWGRQQHQAAAAAAAAAGNSSSRSVSGGGGGGGGGGGSGSGSSTHEQQVKRRARLFSHKMFKKQAMKPSDSRASDFLENRLLG